eukprot:TRINITY_DN2790_c0_g1_i2.p1 TRINITY_DN2790_c0_g1~~TRINITY_DN2790_c0_g1_i2.p1  ORF type:complete len:107 (+),score=0.04 TRINITY_DN2790_c0_g1_i2:367-687(+)
MPCNGFGTFLHNLFDRVHTYFLLQLLQCLGPDLETFYHLHFEVVNSMLSTMSWMFSKCWSAFARRFSWCFLRAIASLARSRLFSRRSWRAISVSRSIMACSFFWYN